MSIPAATEGYTVPPQDGPKEALLTWYKAHAQLCLLLLCLLISCGMEAFIFHYEYFTFDPEFYPQRSIALNGQEYADHRGIALDKKHNSLTLNEVNLPLRTVFIDTWAPTSAVVHGTISYTSSTNARMPYTVSEFTFNPGGVYHSHLARLSPPGTVYTLTVTLQGDDIPQGALITAITINAPPPFDFSLLRAGIMFLLLALICQIRLRRCYRLETAPSDRAEVWGSRTMLALALVACCGMFSFINPATTSPLSLDFQGEANVVLTSDDHQLLFPLPHDEKSLKRFDLYAQLLHAWVHKQQLNLDFTVDPKLESLPNPYDFSLRLTENISYYFECAFKDGKYYLYYGIMPLLLIYLPVWALTGCVPATALALFMLAIPALFSIYLALRSLRLTFPFRANLLLCLLTELTILCSTGVFILLVADRFYSLPRLCGIIFVALFVAVLWALPRQLTQRRLYLMLVLLSLTVPGIVLSSPQMLLCAIAMGLPPVFLLLTRLWRERSAHPILTRQALICLLLPVTLGAAFVMWYNYVRFGSVLDFGNTYTLTGYDIHSPRSYNLRMLCDVLYLYFFEPLEYTKNFPFVLPALREYHDLGFYVFLSHRIPLFALPLMWGVFLCLFRFERAPSEANSAPFGATSRRLAPSGNLSAMRLSGLLLLLTMPLMALAGFPVSGLQARFFGDYAPSCAFALFIPLLWHLHWSERPVLRMFYALVIFLILKSLFIGLLFPLSYDQYVLLPKLSADELVGLGRFLTPFGS